MKTKNKPMTLAGFTLVELLIVMLIVAILAIAMLPMYKKYMCKAKYTAEGLPILATIKTQVDLFIYEKSYAPGIADTVYGWIKSTGTSGSGEYVPATYTLSPAYPVSGTDITQFQADTTKSAVENWHLRTLIKEGELSGKLIQPNDVYYACINPGMPANIDPTGAATMAGDYGYAIGVFGDGNGLPQNSGVATMEVRMSAPAVGTAEDGSTDTTGITVLGTWSNYDGSGIDPNAEGQIRFTDSSTAVKSGCGIWSRQTMSDLNQDGKRITDVQDAVNTLVTGLECGEWEFPQYK